MCHEHSDSPEAEVNSMTLQSFTFFEHFFFLLIYTHLHVQVKVYQKEIKGCSNFYACVSMVPSIFPESILM